MMNDPFIVNNCVSIKTCLFTNIVHVLLVELDSEGVEFVFQITNAADNVLFEFQKLSSGNKSTSVSVFFLLIDDQVCFKFAKLLVVVLVVVVLGPWRSQVRISSWLLQILIWRVILRHVF